MPIRQVKHPETIANRLNRGVRLAVYLCVLILLLAAASFSGNRKNSVRNADNTTTAPATAAISGIAPSRAGYVGSKVCAQCHAPVASKYFRTDMGRSMSEITPKLLEQIPTAASVVDDRIHRMDSGTYKPKRDSGLRFAVTGA